MEPESTFEWTGKLFNQHLGTGEYYLPRENRADLATQVARTYTLAAIKEFAPEVLSSLQDDVWPAFDQIYAGEGSDEDPHLRLAWLRTEVLKWLSHAEGDHEESQLHNAWLESSVAAELAAHHRISIDKFGDPWENRHPGINRLRRAILEWALRFNLVYDWVLDPAILALERESRHVRTPVEERLDLGFAGFWGRSGYGDGCPIDPENHVFDFTTERKRVKLVPRKSWSDGRRLYVKLPAWNPQFMLWPRYETMVNELVRKAIQDYERGLREFMESKGYVRSRRKDQMLHFKAFVRWHIQKRTWNSIAAELEFDLSTVREGALSVADACGIALRVGKAGKPVKEFG